MKKEPTKLKPLVAKSSICYNYETIGKFSAVHRAPTEVNSFLDLIEFRTERAYITTSPGLLALEQYPETTDINLHYVFFYEYIHGNGEFRIPQRFPPINFPSKLKFQFVDFCILSPLCKEGIEHRTGRQQSTNTPIGTTPSLSITLRI